MWYKILSMGTLFQYYYVMDIVLLVYIIGFKLVVFYYFIPLV